MQSTLIEQYKGVNDFSAASLVSNVLMYHVSFVQPYICLYILHKFLYHTKADPGVVVWGLERRRGVDVGRGYSPFHRGEDWGNAPPQKMFDFLVSKSRIFVDYGVQNSVLPEHDYTWLR